MTGSYDFWLVALSVVVACIASYSALDFAARVSAAAKPGLARTWLAAGALCMGTGIWAMHFIGMLAFRLPITMSFDVPITFASLAIAILVSGFALWTVSGGDRGWRRLGGASLLMGLGIAAMHYTGMAAMRMDPPIRYEPRLFALSVLIAVGASVVALWIALRLRGETTRNALWRRIGSALVMGLAISGMYYTGMAAAMFAPDSIYTAASQDVNHPWLGSTIGAVSVLLVGVGLLVSLFDERLAAGEARKGAILEASMDAVITMDHLGRIVEFNAAAELLSRHSRQHAVGRDLGELLVPPEMRDAHRVGLRRYLATGEGPVLRKRVELPVLRADGRRFDAEVSIVRIPQSEPPLFTGTIRDITERKLAEALAQGQKQVLEMIAAGEPQAAILDRLMHVIEAQAPGMLCSVLLLEPDGAHLSHGAAPSLPLAYTQAIDGIAIGASVGSCGTAAFRRAQVIVADIATDPLWADFRELALGHGLRACWCTPITDAGGKILGTFAMYYGQPGVPSVRDRWLIDVATQTAAIAINRHRAEQALHRSMLVLENTFEHMDQGISIADKDLRFVGMNRRFREMFDFPESLCQPGVSSEALLRYNAERGDYGPGDVEEQVRSRLELGRKFEPHHFERELPNGDIIEIRGLPIPGGGFVTVYTDITQRARSERELLRFRAALDLSSDGVYLVDCVTLVLLDCNDGACRALGYRREELVGRTIEGLFADRTPEQLRADYARLIASDISEASLAAQHRRKDGSVFPVEINRRIHRTEQGPIVVGVARDISERQRANERFVRHAAREQSIARLGQLALGKIEREPLFDAAMRTLSDGGMDAAVLYELVGEQGEYRVAAAVGEGVGGLLGQSGKFQSESRWREVLAASEVAVTDRRDLASNGMLPANCGRGPIASGLYAALQGEDRPFGLLAVYSPREDAFDAEDRHFVDTMSALLSSALQRRQTEQRLVVLAQFDPLTALPNRGLLRDRLGQAIIYARRSQQQLGVLFVDLDHFKLINDTHGHHVGDRLIAQVAQRIAGAVRSGDTVGRISGDEFAVVLPVLARPGDAVLVAGKILDALGPPFDLDGHETYTTASIGISIFPDDDEDADLLIKDADAAMYRAKETGRNRFCFYTAELHELSIAKLQLTNDLRHAIERQEYRLYYQPKIDLTNGALTGMEALIRWQHPSRGMVSPMEFIPALEESGLIVQVGEWVLGEACAQLRRWSDAGLAVVPIAVNVSARQFRSGDLAASIQRQVSAAGIAPGLIELEITESCLMDNPDKAIHGLHSLSAAGLKISIDDFGTGYSSLAYLTRLPLTALKIDQSFVRSLHTSTDSAAITRAIIDLAHTLRFTVVAEGIETQEQASFLRENGCEQGQGYLFARPAPAADIASHLRPASAPRSLDPS